MTRRRRGGRFNFKVRKCRSPSDTSLAYANDVLHCRSRSHQCVAKSWHFCRKMKAHSDAERSSMLCFFIYRRDLGFVKFLYDFKSEIN